MSGGLGCLQGNWIWISGVPETRGFLVLSQLDLAGAHSPGRETGADGVASWKEGPKVAQIHSTASFRDAFPGPAGQDLLSVVKLSEALAVTCFLLTL